MISLFAGCSKSKNGNSTETSDTTQKKTYNTPEDPQVARNLARFDSLDLVAFNKKDTALMYKFYNDSVLVAYPDGHETTGSSTRVKDLKDMFEQMPDIKVESHQMKFGSADWTCVTGMLSGSSSTATKGSDGKPVPLTGKNFVVPFCSIAHWKEGRIVEQRMYWDNQTMAKQMEINK
jgi:predicted ester cyclase